MGALHNWVALQDSYKCFFTIVDWHALTSDYADTSRILEYESEMAIDWLAAGIDPAKSTIFVQSEVKEHAELHLLLSMIIPLGWLERVPTYKEQIRELREKNLETYGFLGYPLLQAADILIYKASVVPVGEDQVPHVELTREVARRFNSLYGEVFPEPETRLTPMPRLPGTDGRKMSKSYDNAFYLYEKAESIRPRIMTMMTDPARKRRRDPGTPELCPVFPFHRTFSTPEQIAWADHGCRTAEIGCTDCKTVMADNLFAKMRPFLDKRAEIASHPERVVEILQEGARKARQVAGETLAQVREAMKISPRKASA